MPSAIRFGASSRWSTATARQWCCWMARSAQDRSPEPKLRVPDAVDDRSVAGRHIGTVDRPRSMSRSRRPAASIFRIVDFPPITPGSKRSIPAHARRTRRARKRGLPPGIRSCTAPAPSTVIVMAGEIDMLLDDSRYLKAGDVLIQQGTNHAWVNRGTSPTALPSFSSMRASRNPCGWDGEDAIAPVAASSLQRMLVKPNYGS